MPVGVMQCLSIMPQKLSYPGKISLLLACEVLTWGLDLEMSPTAAFRGSAPIAAP